MDPRQNTGHLAERLRANYVDVKELCYDKASHTTLVVGWRRPWMIWRRSFRAPPI